MSIFPDLELIAQPPTLPAAERPVAKPGAELLVLYAGNQDFLLRVLAAAGYDDPAGQVHLLERPEGADSFALAPLLRELGVTKVILFGQDLPALGLHVDVRSYHHLNPQLGYVTFTINGIRYLVEEPLANIAEAKAAGNNQPAGRLWAALKGFFLREE